MIDKEEILTLKPALKGVYIVGNHHVITNELREFFAQDGYITLGDGNTPIQDIDLSSLAGRIDSKTIINIHAHGGTRHNIHYIDDDTSINFFKKIDGM